MAKLKVKICGMTRAEDYREAVNLGADYVGFIFYSKSPRYIVPEQAAELCRTAPSKPHATVGVFVNESLERVREIYHTAGLDIVQLHGDESPEYVENLGLPVWKVLRIKDAASLDAMQGYSCETFLLGKRLIVNWMIFSNFRMKFPSRSPTVYAKTCRNKKRSRNWLFPLQRI